MFGGGGGFFGGGGMPFGGMPEMRPRKQDNKYYDLLGVNRNSSDNDIKKAFMKLAERSTQTRVGQAHLSGSQLLLASSAAYILMNKVSSTCCTKETIQLVCDV